MLILAVTMVTRNVFLMLFLVPLKDIILLYILARKKSFALDFLLQLDNVKRNTVSRISHVSNFLKLIAEDIINSK